MNHETIFNDILELTKLVFDEIKKSPLSINAIVYYDLYRAMNQMNYEIYVVLQHYLALTLKEDFLVHTTSYASAEEKWRKVLNRDLERANTHIQNYLLQLQHISYDDREENIDFFITQKRPLDDYINHKNFYASLKYYSCGYLKDDSYQLERTIIDCSKLAKEPLKKGCIDLSTYPLRLKVKSQGLQTLRKLLHIEESMKKYILKNICVQDLVLETRNLTINA